MGQVKATKMMYSVGFYTRVKMLSKCLIWDSSNSKVFASPHCFPRLRRVFMDGGWGMARQAQFEELFMLIKDILLAL